MKKLKLTDLKNHLGKKVKLTYEFTGTVTHLNGDFYVVDEKNNGKYLINSTFNQVWSNIEIL